MKMMIPAVALLLLVACGSGSRRDPGRVPAQQVWTETGRASQSAGMCQECHMLVYEGHRCKVTSPCAMCQREHGSRHYHDIVWKCEACQVVTHEAHICNDAKTCDICLHTSNEKKAACELCREGKHQALKSRGCSNCFKQSPVVSVVGITSFCPACNTEVGPNHIHDKTEFCPVCLRDAGAGHVHDATRLCMTCARDVAIDHEHGTTEYCRLCRRDAGPDHKHGETIWCYRCGTEESWPHCHHAN